MSKYRKKSVVIEAEQWFPDKMVEGVKIFDQPGRPLHWFDGEGHAYPLNEDQGWCGTLEGGHVVMSGDWIIKGVKGELYPCKPDIFSLTYEKVEE